MYKKLLLFVFALVISATINVFAQSHKITFEAVGNGTISMKQMSAANGWKWESFESGAEIEEGAWLQTLTVPQAGYQLLSLTCNGTDVTADIKNEKYYNVQVGTEDIHFVATFESDPEAEIDDVTFYVTANGTATFATYYGNESLTLVEDGKTVANPETGECFAYSGEAKVSRGEYIVLTLTPDTDFSITSLLVNDQEMFEKVNHDDFPYTYMTPQVNGPMVIKVFFGDNTVDGISSVQQESIQTPSFNLQGQRISKGQHGVIIQNGKKEIR